jgi:5,6-dimethylbenzimidazole synthase
MEQPGAPDAAASPPPAFDEEFRERLELLLRWRRDVRHFRRDPIPPDVLERLFDLACTAPSVGYSQPWRFVLVEGAEARAAVRANFERCNRTALNDYEGERAALYARLKLSGLDDAPVHLAIFTDHTTASGGGLGQRTMPQTLDYSSVTALFTLWLAARTWGIGVGWVSIIDPGEVASALDVPPSWTLTAYLCIGYPCDHDERPELARIGWQDVDPAGRRVLRR